MSTVLERPQAKIDIQELPNQKRRITVQPTSSSFYLTRSSIETGYPISLIENILEHKGASYLCDEIARDEDDEYIKSSLRYLILGHVAPEDLIGKRLLDFGCGSGSSTIHLAKMFPETEIVGVELCEKSLAIARLKAQHHQLQNIQFLNSPNGENLPDSIGKFDFILLNAVFEHLLPGERLTVMPQLWSLLNAGGIMFFDETPHRYFPIEAHTTNLPLINYLPDSLALICARQFSARVEADDTWELLLRNGIRGGTEKEIVSIIQSKCQERPQILQPKRLGMNDRIDLKYVKLSSLSFKRKLIKALLKTIQSISGYAFGAILIFAIQKPALHE